MPIVSYENAKEMLVTVRVCLRDRVRTNTQLMCVYHAAEWNAERTGDQGELL